jgi:hypothetical protein
MTVPEHIISDGTFIAPSRATSAFRVRQSVSNQVGKTDPSAFTSALDAPSAAMEFFTQ